MTNVHGHSVDLSLLGDGHIIDCGCRDFKFARFFNDRHVFCIDADPKVFVDYPTNVTIMNYAITETKGDVTLYRNGEMTVLTDIYEGLEHERFKVEGITMNDAYKLTGENIDLLKLDCEGAEYFILSKDFRPVPKQISVEFHRHMYPDLHDREYQNVLDTLSKDYNLVYQHETLMDCLFVRKW